MTRELRRKLVATSLSVGRSLGRSLWVTPRGRRRDSGRADDGAQVVPPSPPRSYVDCIACPTVRQSEYERLAEHPSLVKTSSTSNLKLYTWGERGQDKLLSPPCPLVDN